MGRWSRRLAIQFVEWLQLPRGGNWLDVGCGTGSLTNAICAQADPSSVTGCDPAGTFIEFAREHSRDPRVSFVTAGIGNLPARSGGYDSVTSLLAMNFFPDPEIAVIEMKSMAASTATVSACVWDYSERMEFLRYFWDAAASLDPAARTLDEGRRFPICNSESLITIFRSANLKDVRCEAIDIPTIFTSFADYWQPFLGGTGPAPSYVASLDDDRRTKLAEALADALPQEPDNTINLTARAWAIRGHI